MLCDPENTEDDARRAEQEGPHREIPRSCSCDPDRWSPGLAPLSCVFRQADGNPRPGSIYRIGFDVFISPDDMAAGYA